MEITLDPLERFVKSVDDLKQACDAEAALDAIGGESLEGSGFEDEPLTLLGESV